MRKSGSFIYFFGSVGLIVLAIVLTAFIQRSRNPDSVGTEDIRARAGNPTALEMTGKVVSVNPQTGVVKIDSLKFAGETTNDLGAWTMTLGPAVNPASLSPGKTVLLGVESSSFSIESRTFKALEVRTIR